MKDLNDDYFNILVDESCDVSCKEQMALVLCYIDRRGFVMERFIGILYIRDTSALSLKESIASFLAQRSLSRSCILHCFSHQLQFTLVGNSKKCDEVAEVVNLVLAVSNIVGVAFKRRDELRDVQILKVQKALGEGEFQTSKGLNEELGFARLSDTHWGSHFKSFVNFILLFDSIID
ncbi:hypothetical protein CDL12_28581 [Handroanthus impetiginosus]|uniref:DUF4371 domain-containing protein n=1 Tax=Handroanthus impetiginosus TaxID=429701 RepID=A0A2G9G0V5_9LAMI|nr:hypothetical protein CDL12_28581 [Handroanthus impetiginosus]